MFQEEEALLRDVKHVGHTSVKEGVWIGLIVLLASIVFWISVDVAWLPAIAKGVLSLLIAMASGFAVGRMLSAKRERHKNKLEQDVRDERKDEQVRQIEEAKRSGAFDRWEH